MHEYAEYRYGSIRFCNTTVTDNLGSRCNVSSPDPPGPPGAVRCAVASEGATVTLGCAGPHANRIATVTFASFGTPSGTCSTDGKHNTFAVHDCHASNSRSVLQRLCAGQRRCNVTVADKVFAGCDHCSNATGCTRCDPCRHVKKRLAVAVSCTNDDDDAQTAASTTAHSAPAVPLSVRSWSVAYPWSDADSSFDSSDAMLNRVYALCRNTLRVTSLDTWTDSNTRERNVYEGDGFVTAMSRLALQREYHWLLHSARFQFVNPTYFTEYHQYMALLAYEYYMQTADTQLASDYWEILKLGTYAHCAARDVSPTNLVDFDNCSRDSDLWNASTIHDLVDWPMHFRDRYVMTPSYSYSHSHPPPGT